MGKGHGNKIATVLKDLWHPQLRAMYAINVVVLPFCLANGYITDWKAKQTSIPAPVILPPRERGEVLVTWPVLIDQFDRSKAYCKPLLDRAKFIDSSWQSKVPLPTNMGDWQLIDFKTKARRAGCLVLDKGETY